jgi:RNA polymerase subunit RPABC4/transcription elongation factor Spt4
MMNKNCPECCSSIPDAAVVCPACTQRIVGKACPNCLALSPEETKICRHCQSKFKTNTTLSGFRPFRVNASWMATLLVRFSLFPQKAEFNTDKIIITSYGFLGLTSQAEEVLWEKVAGFAHHSGIFWDSISIETRGQTAAVISCLDKDDAKKIKNVLQTLER